MQEKEVVFLNTYEHTYEQDKSTKLYIQIWIVQHSMPEFENIIW